MQTGLEAPGLQQGREPRGAQRVPGNRGDLASPLRASGGAAPGRVRRPTPRSFLPVKIQAASPGGLPLQRCRADGEAGASRNVRCSAGPGGGRLPGTAEQPPVSRSLPGSRLTTQHLTALSAQA